MAVVANSKLKAVMTALRACGQTSVPVKMTLRMVKMQKTVVSHLQNVNEANNVLIGQFGEKNEAGDDQVTPNMDGWQEFVKASNELMETEFELGEPFVLYEKDDQFAWTENMKTPIEIAPNVLVDMDALLEIREFEADIEPKVVGRIEYAESERE